jgi:hypothetical protein
VVRVAVTPPFCRFVGGAVVVGGRECVGEDGRAVD